MKIEALEQIEKAGLEKLPFNRIEKMDDLNKEYKTTLKPNKGFYGVTEIDKGNGLVEHRGFNEFGFRKREFYLDGKLIESAERISDTTRQHIKYDDNGLAYLKEVSVSGEGSSITLAQNATIEKGNITIQTDEYGRTVRSKITDFELSSERQSLSRKLKDSSYLEGDQIGHVIPDSFGGPASKENVVPQTSEVNQSQIKRVENIARDLKREGRSVDYEVKTNYAGKDSRPSSFEPKIIVDGKEYPLDDSLKKIYNTVEGESKLVVDAKETLYKINEATSPMHDAGLEQGIEAAKITFAISTVDNVILFIDGEITANEMARNIAKDTGTAGALGYGAGFVSKGIAVAMDQSSIELIQSLADSNVPAVMVSFGIASYESVIDFAQGKIDISELAYDMGNNALGVAGRMVGAQYGVIIGQTLIPIPGVGAVAGGLVGGMVGYAVASEAYKTAVEYGSKGADALGSKAKHIASATIEFAEENIPEKAANVRNAINSFAEQNNLPFSFN